MNTLQLANTVNLCKSVVGLNSFDHIKRQRQLSTPTVLLALSLLTADEMEQHGVFVNYETAHTQEGRTDLKTVYIGIYGLGVIAVYYAASGEWHECQSYGDFGKNYASGGTWTVIKKHLAGAKYAPAVVTNIIKQLINQLDK